MSENMFPDTSKATIRYMLRRTKLDTLEGFDQSQKKYFQLIFRVLHMVVKLDILDFREYSLNQL